MYNSINVSSRDTSLTIILPEKTNTFLYVAAQLWNSIHKRIVKSECGLETSVSLVKMRVKNLIMEFQAAEEIYTWTEKNFQINSAIISYDIPRPTTITQLKSSDQKPGAQIDIIHS